MVPSMFSFVLFVLSTNRPQQHATTFRENYSGLSWHRRKYESPILLFSQLQPQSQPPKKKKQYHKRNSNRRGKSSARGLDPVISLNMNLDSLAKSREKRSAERAEQLLLRIEKLYEEGYYDSKPDVVSYNIVLNAWARSKWRGSTNKAELLLKRMEDLYYKDGDSDVKPNVITFNCVLNAYARSTDRNAPYKAEKLLQKMNDLYYKDGDEDCLPNRISFHSVMDAHAGSSLPGSADKVKEILDELIRNNITPNVRSFNILLKAYSKNPLANNITMEKIKFVLEEMENYSIVKDVYTYASTISIYAKMGEVEAAEEIVQKMEILYKNGDRKMKPNKFVYSSLINAYAKQGNGRDAEKLLRRMMDGENGFLPQPDVVCFTGVIHAYSSSPNNDDGTHVNRDEAVECAGVLFSLMESVYEREGKLRPNIHTICAMINCLSNKGDIVKAEHIFRKLNKYRIRPNVIVYNALLKCLANSSIKRKPEKAQNILYHIKEQGLHPCVITYNTVILCAAYTQGGTEEKKTAISIAQNTFNQLQENPKIKLTSMSYGVMILACRHLLPTQKSQGQSPTSQGGGDRVDMVKSVFDMCAKDGLVANEVLLQVKKAVPREHLSTIFQIDNEPSSSVSVIDDYYDITYEDLPSEWSCKIRKQ